MEIIKSSLSLFLIFSVILIAISYIIFKVKDRSRIKPYMRVNLQDNSNDIAINSYDLLKEQQRIEQLQKERQMREDNLRQEKLQHEQILMNEQYFHQPSRNNEMIRQEQLKREQLYRQEQFRIEQIRQEQLKLENAKQDRIKMEQRLNNELLKAENRFRVVNELNPVPMPQTVPLVQLSNGRRAANIYDLYSQNEQERMHKLKLAGMYR